MAQLAVLMAGLLLIADSQASNVAEADPSAVQGFLSKYMTAQMQRAWTSNVKHGNSPDALSHHGNLAEHGRAADEGTDPFMVIHDKPRLNPAPQVQDSFAFTSAREEEKAAEKLLANGSNTPIMLSAIGVGLLALVTMLGVRIRRGMRPAAVLAGMEMQSQAELSAVPNIFYPGGDEAKLHGFITTLAASGFPLQATLKADEGDFMWNPLNLLPSGGWQPAIFLVSPVAGGINGGGRINSLVARIMNKSDEIDHKLAALAKALEVNASDDGAAALTKALDVKTNITKISLLDNEIGGDAAAAIAHAEAIAKALEAIAVPWTTI